MASIPACATCAGVSKSGSPAPRPMTSLPSALSRAARAVTASVGEGLTRWTRRETDRVTYDLQMGGVGRRAILRDRPLPNQRTEAPFRGSTMDQNPFRLEVLY